MGTGTAAGHPTGGTDINSVTSPADIVIVGSGISGTLAATALARTGYSIVLIDRHAVYPPDFRAEHLDGPMIEQLRRLGFLAGLTEGLYKGETVTVARSGRVIATAPTVNYGLRYENLVNRARAMLPAHVRQVTGRVTGVDASDTVQRVRLSGGGTIEGRLVIIATGQGRTIAEKLGIQRRMVREGHSLTFGFEIESAGNDPFPDSFVVYQRERIRDRMDYFAAFAMGQSMRVNLFTYRDYKEPWTKAFLNDPGAGLAEVMPGLADTIGPYRALLPVVARPIDLYVSQGYRRDGVVLIGDAFQASCPATGMGMVRVLSDIERLSTVHAPRWLATQGMGAVKISTFYDDPIKRACDAKALHDAEYRRASSTETSLPWVAHRARVRLTEQVQAWLHRPPSPPHPRINSAGPETSLVPG